MAKKLIGLVAGIAVIGGSAKIFAQEGAKPASVGEGTVMVKGKNYSLTHVLAYETKFNDEEIIAVVLSGQAVSSEDLKKAREEEKEGQDGEFKRPYIRLGFTKAGELKFWSAGVGDTSLGRRSSGKNPTRGIEGARRPGERQSQPAD